MHEAQPTSGATSHASGTSRLSPNALGSLYMALGSLAYVMNDAAVRFASDSGMSIYQVMCLRGILMALLFAAVAGVRGERIQRSHLERPALLRVAAEMVATFLFFSSLVRMEFANAQAILQVAPLAVMLGAALILGENVSVSRYVAIVVGFVGVVIIVRPATEGFTIWSIAVLGTVIAMVGREFATRSVSASTPALSIALMTAIGNTSLGGVISLASGWDPITAEAAWAIALASGLLFFGYLFTIQTVRVGDLSVSAPFRYTVLLGAVVAGYVVFDEVPDAFTIIGSIVIVAAGLYSISLDRREALETA